MENGSSNRKVVVLGAGVNGLSTALYIKDTWPDLEVEIVAEKFSPNTTSDGSGGWWTPYVLGETSIPLVKELSKVTYDYLTNLALSSSACNAGVQQLSGYCLATTQEQTYRFYHDVVDGYRILEPAEINKFPKAKSGHYYVSVQVDVSRYLPWLMDKFKALGGKVRCAKVHSLEEFSNKCDLVVNCCGLGSKDLLNDAEMMPVRGQVLKVEAPWIKHFYTLKGEDDTFNSYILPGTRQVVVGGTAQKGDWNTEPTDKDSARIWKSATEFMPSLKGAKILSAWAGLRPARTTLRLESEKITVNGHAMNVIHNYGHGGSGVTLFWGCTQRVAAMTQDILKLQTPNKNSKLSKL